MRTYTSYFGAMKKMPSDIVPIAITLYTPKWFGGRRMQELSPTPSILSAWQSKHDELAYKRSFDQEVLQRLSADRVYADIQSMSGGHDAVLLCYEKPGAFCHRHLVAEWLNENLDTNVFEWTPTGKVQESLPGF